MFLFNELEMVLKCVTLLSRYDDTVPPNVHALGKSHKVLQKSADFAVICAIKNGVLLCSIFENFPAFTYTHKEIHNVDG